MSGTLQNTYTDHIIIAVAGKWPSNAPHEALLLMPMCQIEGWQPPKQADDIVFLGGGWQGKCPSKCSFVPTMRCIAATLECFEGHTPPQPPQNYIRFLGGSSPINQRWQRGEQDFMCGTRGPFPPMLAVVGRCCDGGCSPMTSDYFYSYIDSHQKQILPI